VRGHLTTPLHPSRARIITVSESICTRKRKIGYIFALTCTRKRKIGYIFALICTRKRKIGYISTMTCTRKPQIGYILGLNCSDFELVGNSDKLPEVPILPQFETLSQRAPVRTCPRRGLLAPRTCPYHLAKHSPDTSNLHPPPGKPQRDQHPPHPCHPPKTRRPPPATPEYRQSARPGTPTCSLLQKRQKLKTAERNRDIFPHFTWPCPPDSLNLRAK
jgi:hypothetical protein